jgi:transcriptional regulator with XRE-family HTH domain
MELDEFGELLSAQVRRQGLTMAEFAAKVGLSASTLSRVRTGARPPTQAQAERWAKALALDGDARSDFVAAAMLARTPAPVREKLRQVEAHARDAHRDRTRLESDYGSYRSRTGFHDGWWLSYSLSFRCDGRVQRSLLHFAGGEATLQVRDSGMLLYSYHGSCEPLGDKLFVRVAEDRGGAEYVQITAHSLFDLSRPTLLYGLVSGISGKDLRHPMSYPAAARIILLHAGSDAALTPGSPALTRLEACLGSYEPRSLRAVWPSFLGDDAHLRTAQCIGEQSLEAEILARIDNRPGAGDLVLRAVLG